MYLYKTTIIKDTSVYYAMPGAEATAHASAKTDFETNHKANCLEISERVLNDTTSVIVMNFADFDTAIASPVSWVDVQYMDGTNHYELSLMSSVEL
jgi:hypothetical protein